jgi:hypothetical protein
MLKGRRHMTIDPINPNEPDPCKLDLQTWLAMKGTRTGTFTFNGVTYTDLNEVEWRRANNEWLQPEEGSRR